MNKYTITWGTETKTILAESEQEVWAQFAQSHDLAMRHPHLHEPKIELAKEPRFESPPAAPPAASVSIK